MAAGYVAAPAALADDGVIVASATEGAIEERSLSVFDVIHVDPTFDGRPATVGDTLLLYRDAGDVLHPRTRSSLGRIVYPTGLATVVALEGDVASAVITSAFAPVVAGQRVQYQIERGSLLPAGERPVGEGLVVGLREKSAIVEPYAVIYLDLPPGGDLVEGSLVRIFRLDFEEGRELPPVDVGTARVLDAGGAVATAVVLGLERSDLKVGDRYEVLALEP